MADNGIGCAGNVLANCFCSLWNKVLEKVKMVYFLPRAVKMVYFLPRAVTQMEKDVKDLDNQMHDIKTELDQAQQIPKRTVQAWLDDAEALERRSDSIGAEYKTYQQHKNYIGCCPKFLRRYKISKHVRECNRNVSDLLSKRAQPEFPSSGQYGDPTPRPQIPIPITETGIVADAKRSEQRELAERWLTDENSNVQRIAIIGMGGVGKTSLLDAINNSQRVKSSFEFIIKVIVSRNDISFVQNNVAERLKLRLPENSVERVDTLRNFFKNKKYVILLDDMWLADSWTPDKLQELGVSFSDTGSKFVITTRDEQVCEMMNVQKTIKVEPLSEEQGWEPLSEEQGWELFRSKAFVNQNGNVPHDIIEPVARRIAKECKGLTLAITVVGAAMAHHTEPHQWQAALEQMQNAPETFGDLYPSMDAKLFQCLRWSYNVLSEDLQICFLSLAAYPEDAVIYCEQVIDMWISEGLVKESGDSYVKESGDSYLHDTGHSYIQSLANRCFIDVAGKDSVGRIFSVQIHDILRDLAVRIAAEKEQSNYFKAGEGMINFPLEEDVRNDCAKLSLMRNNLQCLPTTFARSSLSVLLLGSNPDIKEIPESFLNELPSLRVLDLSSTGITSLPPSIGNLKQLASLQLQHTGIRELPESIAYLKVLQFLNVSFCFQLLCLPKKISELKSLRALDIRGCKGLRHLPRGISELVSLERLRMLGSSIRLEFEAAANEETRNACLKDLQSLRTLRVLWVSIKSPVKEEVMVNWSKMRDLLLEFEDANGEDGLPQDMQDMKNLESLSLWNCDVERLPGWVTQFGNLACLCLIGCKRLKELPSELPSLRVLWMDKCDQLKELELGMDLSNLREITLLNLESLDCVRLGTLAAASGSEGLGDLPLKLKFLEVRGCSKLKRLDGRWEVLHCLQEIRGETEWWDTIQWQDPKMKTLLETKFILYTF